MMSPAPSASSRDRRLPSLVLEAAPVALIVVDTAATIVLANAAAHRLFGYDDGELRASALERLIPAGLPEVACETVARRKDGGEMPVEIALAPLDDGTGDRLLTIADVSGRKRADELRALNVEFGQHALAVVDVVQLEREAAELVARVVDVPLVRLGVFDPATNMVGFDAQIGWPSDLHHGDAFNVATSRQAVETIATGRPVFAASGGPGVSYELSEALLREGMVQSVMVPIGVKDAVVGLMLVAARDRRTFSSEDLSFMMSVGTILGMAIDRDRREQRIARLNEELLQHCDELESFSYSVAHDLRAPLRTAAGFAAALQEDYGPSLDAEAQRFIGLVISGTTQMGQLIEALLALARVSRQEVTHVPVQLSAIAESLIDELRLAEPDRNVIVEIAPKATVVGDPSLLRAALQNLLSNAWKFTRDRDPARISVWVDRSRGEVAIAVKDNGIGFSTGYPKELFVPFKRLHGGAYEGTGIGLATVERIVRRHGGRIWAESEVDQGATFFFTVDETKR